ncbi:hypothetical protein Q7O_003320 [Pectobacterium carotovorum subsp. carotovorum PCCS1]|nr:hypothetical protein [Pectobacterium carotovorum subsp. carotovorum PCCS1]
MKKSFTESYAALVSGIRVQLHKAPIFRGFLLFGNKQLGY